MTVLHLNFLNIAHHDSENNQELEEFYQAKSSFNTPVNDFKSTQTSFCKSNNEVNKIKNTDPEEFNSKMKSQRYVKPVSGEEVHELESEVQLIRRRKYWKEKLLLLAEKLKNPAAEKILKNKIHGFLKQFPSNFDDEDEEGQRFRDKLPDHIVNKLKTILGDTKIHLDSYPIRPITVPRKTNNQACIRSVIKSWVKMLPVKKTDFLGKPIKNNDILESIIQRLEPFILYRPADSERDFKIMLTSYVTEIVQTIPLEDDMNNEKEVITSIVKELVENILALQNLMINKKNPNAKKSGSVQNIMFDNDFTKSKEIENCVAGELSYLLKNSDVYINENVREMLERKIMTIFSDPKSTFGMFGGGNFETDISYLLKVLGELPEFQAMYISKELVKKITNTSKLINGTYKLRNALGRGGAYSEACLVYAVPQIKITPKIPKDEDKYSNLRIPISLHIERWLCSIQMHLPLVRRQTFRDLAISALTKSIINELCFLNEHNSSRNIAFDEHEHLQHLIFKWIRKLTGEDNIEIIQQASGLQKNIEKVLHLAEQYSDCNYENPGELFNYLFEEIIEWYSYVTKIQSINDAQIIEKNIKHLAGRIVKVLKSNTSLKNVMELIDKEVELWSQKMLKMLPQNCVIEELKSKIKNVLFEKTQDKKNESLRASTARNDMSTKKELIHRISKYTETTDKFAIIREVAAEINNWLASLPPAFHPTHISQEAIQKLASEIVGRHTFLELNHILQGTDKEESKNLKYIISKWLKYKVVIRNHLEFVTHVEELMQRLQTTLSVNRDFFLCNNQGNKNCFTIRYSNDIKSINHKRKIVGYCDNEIDRAKLNEGEYYYYDEKQSALLNPLNCNIKQNPRYLHRISDKQCYFKSQRRQHYLETKRPNRLYRNYPQQSSESRSYSYEPISSHFLSTKLSKQNTSQLNCPYYCNKYSAFTFNPLQHFPFSKNAQDNIIGYQDYPPELHILSDAENMSPASMPPNPTITSKHQSTDVDVNLSLSENYEYYDQIFRKRCKEIPSNEFSLEQRSVIDDRIRNFNNIIWKTYFRLKADPSVEHDSKLFETAFDDQLDVWLDHLPQTEQIMEFRSTWKSRVINDILKMIEYERNLRSRSLNSQTKFDPMNKVLNEIQEIQ